jgi:hypothetical protein
VSDLPNRTSSVFSILVLGCSILLPSTARAATSDHDRVAALLHTADALLETAAEIHRMTPHTEAEVDALFGGGQGVAPTFYNADRAFQASLHRAPVRMENRGYESAVLNLSQAETFLHSAAADAVASCNEHDSGEDLRVARADIAEAHRNFAGRINEDFAPPDITNEVSGGNECAK